MLDAHPDLVVPPETQFIPAIWEVWERTHDVAATLNALASHPRWPFFRLDIESVRARVSASAGASSFAQILRAFYTAVADRSGKARWGDKSPVYALHMPLIAKILPEAHFVHVIRDGRDVAISLRRLWWGFDTIEKAALHWLERVRSARAAAPSVRYTEVYYERLITAPREELMRLCRFIALPFDQRMIAPHLTFSRHAREIEMLRQVYVNPNGPGTGAATEAQLRAMVGRLAEPPDAARVGAWRTELSGGERGRFEQIAGGLLHQLGYPVG